MNEIDNDENNNNITNENTSFFSNSDYFLLEDKNDKDLKKKKDLVQSEIINKNFEFKHFQDFCDSREKVNGNIYLFSYDELKALISDFAKYHTPHPSSGAIGNVSQFENNKPCKLIEKSLINDRKLKISISNPKEVKTSFYQQNYTSYDVSTDLTLWKVSRRYSDFIWLRETLIKLYPGIYCPPLPEKKPGPSRLEEKFIERRRLFLTQFINDLAKNEIFKSSEVLIDFLSIKDRDRFERSKEIYNLKNSPVLLEENSTFTGNANLMEDSTKIDNYFNNIKKYFEMQGSILDEMKVNLNLYYTNINQAYLNLCEIEKGFNLLNKLNSQYSVKEEISKAYYEFYRFFKNWKSIEYEENEIIKKHVKRFFKYVSMESKAFIELIDKRIEFKNNYLEKSIKLNDKKEKLWKEKNLNKWEIEEIKENEKLILVNDKKYALSRMCTYETNNVNESYDMLCYLNYTINEEFKQLINTQSKKFIINIKDFSEEFKNNLNKAVDSWSKIASLIITKV